MMHLSLKKNQAEAPIGHRSINLANTLMLNLQMQGNTARGTRCMYLPINLIAGGPKTVESRIF